MGLFDFFKGNKKVTVPAAAGSDQASTPDVKFETRLTDRQITSDKALVEKIAVAIIAEDPFAKPFNGKMDADFQIGSRRIFEFEDVTTMNVALEEDFTVVIEGIALGKLPAEKAAEVKPYSGKTMLTAYVYVTGGKSKGFEDGQVVERMTPYGLTIYFQFS